MFQSPHSHVPCMSQFSNASRTPRSSARRTSGSKTSRSRGNDSGTGRFGIRPVKPQTSRQPNRSAASISRTQPSAVCGSVSVLP